MGEGRGEMMAAGTPPEYSMHTHVHCTHIYCIHKTNAHTYSHWRVHMCRYMHSMLMQGGTSWTVLTCQVGLAGLCSHARWDWLDCAHMPGGTGWTVLTCQVGLAGLCSHARWD